MEQYIVEKMCGILPDDIIRITFMLKKRNKLALVTTESILNVSQYKGCINLKINKRYFTILMKASIRLIRLCGLTLAELLDMYLYQSNTLV